MNYEEFIQELMRMLNSALPTDVLKSGVRFQLTEITKNNGIVHKALEVVGKEKISTPVIYLEHFYESYIKGISMEKIRKSIVNRYLEGESDSGIDDEFINQNIMNFNKAREALKLMVVSKEKNPELLEKVPHREMQDLAVICYLELTQKDATVRITEELLAHYKKTFDEIYDVAYQNMLRKGFVLERLQNVIRNLLYKEIASYKHIDENEYENLIESVIGSQEEKESLYYVTANDGRCGASLLAMPDFLEQIAQWLGDDLVILCCSIYEIFILPAVEVKGRYENLKEVVQYVSNVINREEVLSSEIYRYDRNAKDLEQIKVEIDSKVQEDNRCRR